jgi:hypothetical protein
MIQCRNYNRLTAITLFRCWETVTLFFTKLLIPLVIEFMLSTLKILTSENGDVKDELKFFCFVAKTF